MAEKRSPEADTSSAVPSARAAAEPDRADPPRQRTGKAAATPAKTAKSAKATKATKATKTAKATKATKTTKSAKPAKAAAPAAPAESAPSAERTGPAEAVERVDAVEPAEVAEPVGAVEPAGRAEVPPKPAPPGAWAAAGWETLQRLDQPPQQLAALAVAELGPRAAAWVGWLRATYPDPPVHGIVRLAARDARRAGGATALAAAVAGGPVPAAISLPAALLVRATVVLRIAAAYGHDPSDPRRAGDLLELLGFAHPVGTGQPRPRSTGPAATVGRLGLGWLAVRSLGGRRGLRRALVATAVRTLTTASNHDEQLHLLAHRAARYYRPGG